MPVRATFSGKGALWLIVLGTLCSMTLVRSPVKTQKVRSKQICISQTDVVNMEPWLAPSLLISLSFLYAQAQGCGTFRKPLLAPALHPWFHTLVSIWFHTLVSRSWTQLCCLLLREHHILPCLSSVLCPALATTRCGLIPPLHHLTHVRPQSPPLTPSVDLTLHSRSNSLLCCCSWEQFPVMP